MRKITRRNFLRGLGAAGLLLPAARVPGIGLITQAGPRLRVQASGGGGVVSALQSDWAKRIADPGVLWAQRFANDTDVSRFRLTVNDPDLNARIIRVADGGIMGDGCMRQFVEPGGTGGGSWGRPLGPITGDINQPGFPILTTIANQADNENRFVNLSGGHFVHPDYVGDFVEPTFGEKIWFQARLFFSAGRFDGSQPAGKIIMFVVQRITPDQEIVISALTDWSGGYLGMYTNFGARWNSKLTDPQGGQGNQANGDSLQPGGPYNDTCVIGEDELGGAFTNCYVYQEGVWITILCCLTPGHDNVNETLGHASNPKDTGLEIWVAGPTETTYRKLVEKRDFEFSYDATYIGGAAQPPGWSWVNFSTHSTGGESAAGFHHDIDQVIHSISWIEPPAVESAPPPAWFLAMDDKTWTQIAAGAGQRPEGIGAIGEQFDVWTGAGVDQKLGSLVLAANGGHNNSSDNSVIELLVRDENPRWRRLTVASTATGGSEGNGDYGDGNMRAVHGWHRCCWGDDKIWYAGMDGMWFSGDASTRCWNFDLGSIRGASLPVSAANAPWNNLGEPSMGSFTAPTEAGVGCYDRIRNRVWACTGKVASNTGRSFYSIDCRTNALTSYPISLPSDGDSGQPRWGAIAHDIDAGYMILGCPYENQILVLDLSNPTGTGMVVKVPTGPGTNPSSDSDWDGAGAVYHRPSRSILVWNVQDGVNIWKLKIPSNPLTGTYAWSVITPAGSNAVTPPGPLEGDFQGAYSKFNIIENMGNGQACLVTCNNVEEPSYAYKLTMDEIT